MTQETKPIKKRRSRILCQDKGTSHELEPIGGDIYRCSKCMWVVDMLEDADGY